MSTKNFASYGDLETLFSSIQGKATPISYADWLLLTPQQQETGNWLVTGVPGADLSSRVLALETGKADTDIVAADFNAGTSYTAGNYCIYDGKLYKFKANHSGAWSAADVDEIKIAGELSLLKSGLTSVDNKLVSAKIPYDATAGIYPVSVRPKMGYQIALGARNVVTGAFYLLWYDDSVSGFRVGKILEGNAPSDGDNIVLQYFA